MLIFEHPSYNLETITDCVACSPTSVSENVDESTDALWSGASVRSVNGGHSASVERDPRVSLYVCFGTQLPATTSALAAWKCWVRKSTRWESIWALMVEPVIYLQISLQSFTNPPRDYTQGKKTFSCHTFGRFRKTFTIASVWCTQLVLFTESCRTY